MAINIGRGGHVVDADLIAALGLGAIILCRADALKPEPAAAGKPAVDAPKVTVMPHVARRPTVAQLVTEIAAVDSIEAGGGLLQQIDKATGY